MTIEQFIQKAIEGGYKMFGYSNRPLFSWSVGRYWGGWLVCVRYGKYGGDSIDHTKRIEEGYNDFDADKIFLDHLAWQAVGKVEGWVGGVVEIQRVRDVGEKQASNAFPRFQRETHKELRPSYKEMMHRMIDALAEGRTLEEFISTL